MRLGRTLAEDETHEQGEGGRADENDLLRALQDGDNDAFVLLMQRLESPAAPLRAAPDWRQRYRGRHRAGRVFQSLSQMRPD